MTALGTREKLQADGALAGYYGDDFYRNQMAASLASAVRFVALLSPVLRPASVVDVGCGRGTWLKAFRDQGASRVVGCDGPWNTQANMIDPGIVFHGVDLNQPIAALNGERFDLAMSLEVAEHLDAASAEGFVRALTRFSDVVMFGAAFTGQGGVNHINEQPHSYWAALFARYDYVPFDFFRPQVWGEAEIPYWYQQNTFLYVRQGSALIEALRAAGHVPLANPRFMDCVHPALYERFRAKVAARKSLRGRLRGLVSRALRRDRGR